MADTNILKDKTEYLFNIDFWSEEYDETEEERWHTVENLLKEYPWKDIFCEWKEYLYNNCPTSDDVINFMNLFFAYEGQNQIIPNAVAFCGYLYYRLGDRITESEAQTMMDSIAIPIFQNSGLISKNDTCIALENDPRIIAEVNRLKATQT